MTTAATVQPPRSSFAKRGLKAIALFPFRVSWRMATYVEKSLGILLTLLFGAALLIAGLVLCSSLIGFFFGAPMVVAGAFLLLRSLY